MSRGPTSYREAALREMGLAPLWRLRRAGEESDKAMTEAPPVPERPAAPAPEVARPAVEPPAVGAGVDARRPLAAARGFPPASSPAARPAPAPQVTDAPSPGSAERNARIAALDWPDLEADIRACGACRLHERRRQAVPGVGDRQAEWLFVGEGPGAEEDARGEPFVGAAGRLLDNMLAAIDLKRGEGVYIANAVKCRPLHNRTPEADEIACCFPYLQRQIELIQPRLIVALGRPAAQALLGGEVKIGAARGKVFHFGDIPVVVTYHPAYLLRNQTDKGKAWEDLCFARRLMGDLRNGG